MADKLTTLYHPTLPDVSRAVPADDVDEWTKSGWTKTETKAVKAAKVDDSEK